MFEAFKKLEQPDDTAAPGAKAAPRARAQRTHTGDAAGSASGEGEKTTCFSAGGYASAGIAAVRRCSSKPSGNARTGTKRVRSRGRQGERNRAGFGDERQESDLENEMVRYARRHDAVRTAKTKLAATAFLQPPEIAPEENHP
ncbi:hypothetical protein MRX96_013666 [Rhipicephalus microplus]